MPISFTNSGVVFNDGTTQTSAFSGYSLLRNEQLTTGTLYTTDLAGTNSPVMIQFQYYSAQGGPATVTVNFRWGLGSLTNNWTPHNGVGVNFVVTADPQLITFVVPSTASTVYLQCDQSGLNDSFWFCSVIQL